jgi:hypothetical protein
VFEQPSELIIAFLASFLVLTAIFLRKHLPRSPRIYIPICFMLGAYVFTIVEGFFADGSFWNNFFNSLEHLCYALSGIAFMVGCWILARPDPYERGAES